MAKEWEIITKTNFGGNKTYELREKEDNNEGCAILFGLFILWVLIFSVIVVLFTGPYFLIDRNFKPFEFKWLKNYNVWIFCISTWIFALTLFVMVKSFTRFSSFTENAFEQTYETPYLTFGLFIPSMSFFASFLFEVKINEYANYLYAVYFLLIGWLLNYLIKNLNSETRYGFILYFIVLLFLPFAWVKSNNFKIYNSPNEINEVKLNTSIKAVSESNNTVTPVEETGDYIIDEETAKEQYRSFNTIMVNGNPEELNNLLSDQLDVYMSLKNQSKNSVIKDKISYQKKWQLTNVSAQKFERLNDQEFEYTTIVSLFKKSDPDFKRDFLISGVLGFDRSNKIKSMVDKETISLYVENPIKTETYNDISGSSWSILRNETVPAGYFSFKPDGSFNYNLIDDQNYKWSIEEETLIINISDFATLTCTLTEGDLLCNGKNKEGENWSINMVRKK